MSDDNGLKPCPFCGGKADIVLIGNDRTTKRKVVVKCTKCYIQKTTAGILSPIVTLVKWSMGHWNTRCIEHENNKLRAVLKQCEDALDKLKPETECPFCLENEPCGHCMEMARVAGQVAKALTSVQNALKWK